MERFTQVIKLEDIILLVLLLLFFGIINYYINKIDKKEWNNGNCPHCNGGVWKYDENKKHHVCSNCKRTLFKF